MDARRKVTAGPQESHPHQSANEASQMPPSTSSVNTQPKKRARTASGRRWVALDLAESEEPKKHHGQSRFRDSKQKRQRGGSAGPARCDVLALRICAGFKSAGNVNDCLLFLQVPQDVLATRGRQKVAPPQVNRTCLSTFTPCKDRKSTRLNSSHSSVSRMPSSA